MPKITSKIFNQAQINLKFPNSTLLQNTDHKWFEHHLKNNQWTQLKEKKGKDELKTDEELVEELLSHREWRKKEGYKFVNDQKVAELKKAWEKDKSEDNMNALSVQINEFKDT